MEEKNELNDIILNKSGSGSNTKKLLLAIAALTLILIIVLVIMNSLKSESNEPSPEAAAVPKPSAPTEVIDDPLFEPVEVIQEGANESTTQDLGEIAQKIKQESFQNAPVAETMIPAIPTPVQQPKPAIQTAPAKPQPALKPVRNVVNTPTIKKAKPTEAKPAVTAVSKPVAEPVKTAASASHTTTTPAKAAATPVKEKTAASKPTKKAVDTTGTYYIQVGSFSKEPDKKLFERLNASGLKYTTSPNGSMTKVMVGPFQGEKAARDVLDTVKRNVEAGAYITKG
ncbi:MAG: SPOR domain-containing protein [Sulfuricurvum sp.]|nr:SPOR domain-containing protein [Sulfuricurvum sp.]